MIKFRVVFPQLRDHIFTVEAENTAQAITRAEIKRKELFNASATNVQVSEYKEDKPKESKEI
jgi:hypothetical protein